MRNSLNIHRTAQLAGIGVGSGYPVRVMAVLNVSPESFFAASVKGDAGALFDAAQQAVAEGADFIDVGAMSTAPYLPTQITAEEETRRMVAALEVLNRAVSIPISCDSKRAVVAAAALAVGARIVNDVCGLRDDPAMADVAAGAEGAILMAAQSGPSAEPPVGLVQHLFEESLKRADAAGIAREQIVLDPGIGFFPNHTSSSVEVNCTLLARLNEFMEFGRPLLVGVSRKSFLGKLTGRTGAEDRLPASLAAAAVAVYNGAAIIRAHDVAATVDAVRVAQAIRTSSEA